MPSNQFRLVPGELSLDYCFTTFQKLNVDMFSIAQVISLNGSTFYNIGPNEPDPDKRDFPWWNTNSGQWFYWNIDVGLWVRPHPVPASSQSRIMWIGTENDLQAYDGGDTNPAGDASGPMWSVDHDFDARFPVGPGTMPAPASTVINPGDTGGNNQVTLPVSALPPHQHIVPVCSPNSNTSDPTAGQVSTVQYGIGKGLGSGNVVDDSAGTYARSFPLTSSTSSDPPSASPPDPIDLLPPYRGIFFIKRTSRQFYSAPF